MTCFVATDQSCLSFPLLSADLFCLVFGILILIVNSNINYSKTSTEVLSSDDDDIDQMNSEYLENLARMATKNSAQQGVNMTAKIEEYNSDDDVSLIKNIQTDIIKLKFYL